MPNSNTSASTDQDKPESTSAAQATSQSQSQSYLQNLLVRYKKPLLILSILICSLVGLHAFKLMMADIKGYQTQRMLERFQKHNKITSQADLDHAYKSIHAARWWAPKYPKFIQHQALLLKWQATSPEYLDRPEQADILLREALELYAQELEQRPTWPYAWSAYANTKLMLGEIDEKFAFALDRTFYYGPWESQIQLEIIQTGLDAWPYLDLDSKKLIFKTLSYAFQGNRFLQDIIQLSKDRNIFAVVCLMPEHTKYLGHVQTQCKKALAAFSLPSVKTGSGSGSGSGSGD